MLKITKPQDYSRGCCLCCYVIYSGIGKILLEILDQAGADLYASTRLAGTYIEGTLSQNAFVDKHLHTLLVAMVTEQFVGKCCIVLITSNSPK